MTTLDWVVVSLYIFLVIGLSIFLSRGQKDDTDYYVGGRNLPWWAVGISVLATQSSAISFVSIPAFVALREGGGLKWLQYELAVPLAMIFIMIFLVPRFREMKLVSVFEFVERRFGHATSQFLSLVFLISRGFGTGVGVYATALVLSAMIDIEIYWTIILIGIVAIIYDTIGGIAAVVYSDVLQMVLIVIGALISIYYCIDIAGGFSSLTEYLDPSRLDGVEMAHGFDDDSTAPFWAYLVGGFFLYSSYYGTDQSQVQRALSTTSALAAKRSLLLNGLARFPLTLLYICLGLALIGAYYSSPVLQSAIPEDHLDYLVPKFILIYLPPGVRGLILAAILAAAMSSLDSSINSLSAVTMRDYVERNFKLTPKAQLMWGKITTVIWGIIVTGCALAAGNIAKTIVEAINKVGSAFYGPVLATFLVGLLSRKISGPAILIGVIAGVGTNLYFWIAEVPLHWMWWNLVGFVVTVATAYMLNLTVLKPHPAGSFVPDTMTDIKAREKESLPVYLILFAYFLMILSLAFILHGYAQQ